MRPRRGGASASAALAPPLALLIVLLAGCTPSAPVPVDPTARDVAPTSLGEPGAPGCAPASPMAVDPASGFTEVQGTATSGNSLYGLVMTPVPLEAGAATAKFVWRVTGSGDPAVTLTRPDGSPGVLAWGPEEHGGSSYDRPGDEWGTGVVFDVPGCWTVDVRRGAVTASVYLDVAGP